ncbi:hypothetical protein BHM03_00027137 [Ensete ventricosum]|nr:hypothetical protein BHM03_00027137 [Ensete ventricosum]
MRTTLRPAAYKPPSAPSHSSLPKKLTREELRDRSTKGLYWHCNELWSRNHRCKKGELSMIKSIKEYEEEVQEREEENTKEDLQPADCTTHALAGHADLQVAKVEESFKQQHVTVLTNNLMNDKGEQVTLCEKHGSEVMMMSTQRLQKLAEISSASTESSRLPPTKLYNLHMLILQEEPLAHIRLFCCPHPQRAESKRIVQETQETQIIQPRPSLARILYLQKLYLFVCRHKLFLKYHIQPNQLWLLKYSQISSYFYDFSKEWTIMLKTLPDDDHRSTAHDRKKIVSFQRQYRHGICDTKLYWMEIKILKEQEEVIHTSTIYRILIVTMPSTSVLVLLDHGNVFAIGADILGIGIGTTLMQGSRFLIYTEALPTFHTMLLIYKWILIATEFEVWHDTGQQHK